MRLWFCSGVLRAIDTAYKSRPGGEGTRLLIPVSQAFFAAIVCGLYLGTYWARSYIESLQKVATDSHRNCKKLSPRPDLRVNGMMICSLSETKSIPGIKL